MTVGTTSIVNGPYVGNGASDTFSYTFRVTTKNELSVYETTDTGVQTLLVVDTHYTVNNVGVDAGGTITRITGNLPLNYQWYIRANYDEDQDTSFTSQGSFHADVHEAQMDHITFLIQQLQDQVNRSVRLDKTIEIDGDFVISDKAADRADAYLAFDTNGDLELVEGSTLVADLASVANGKGASTIGVEDSAGNFTAADVEAALAEILSRLVSAANGNGASMIGVEDSAGNFTAADVEAALAELQVNIEEVPTEGSWTPTLQDGSFSDAEGQTYSVQRGDYQKVGSMVYIQGFIAVSSLGTLAGSQSFIGGLPFPPASPGTYGTVAFGSAASLNIAAGIVVTGLIGNYLAAFQLQTWDLTTGVSAMTISEVSSGAELAFSGFYMV